MKMILCVGGPIKIDYEGNSYPQAFTEEVLERYNYLARDLTLFTRTILIEPLENNSKKVRKDKLKVVACPNLNSLQGIMYSRKRAKNILKKEISNVDFVMARVPSQIGNLAIEIATEMNKPYFVEVAGCGWDAFWNHSLRGKIIAPFMYYTTKKAVKNSSYAIYVTNKFLQERYPCIGYSIGCSDVELPSLNDSILVRRIDKIMNKKDNKPIILGTTAAVNVRYKGQEYVIEAISKLAKKGYNFEYHLVGGGDNSYLKSIAKKYNVVENVKFIGSLPHEKVFDYLDNIDIYIQPSKTEGLPRALIEALSRGCPSIGSDVGGIPELLNKEFTFHGGSVDEICELLKKMDKNSMIEEANRSFEKAKEFDRDILNKKREEFYRNFAKGVMKND